MMIKINRGYITNPKTGITKDIIVKSATPNTLKDILIGGGAMLIGITYLTITAFRNGALKFEEAEFNAMKELDLI